MDNLAGNSIDTIRLTTGGVVNNMTAAQALNVVVTTGGNNPTLTVKNGTDLGQVDTVKITVDDGAAALSTVALGTPVLTGVEKLQIVANDTTTVAALTGATSLDSITLSGTRAVTITTGAAMGNANTKVDASAMSGVFTYTATNATAAALISGGSGADVITTSAFSDVVDGGAGIDSITVTAGTGVDIRSTVTSTANMDLITGFVSANEDFDYNGTLANGTGAAPTVAAAEVVSAATFAAGLADASAGNAVVFVSTTNLAGQRATDLAALYTGAPTVAEAETLIASFIGTGGELNGAIAALDSTLGASDAVLLVLDDNTGSVILRITNTSTTTANTLTSDEIQVVGVFSDNATWVAGDFI